jgi:nucleoside-diphosphate-sugar epimerase
LPEGRSLVIFVTGGTGYLGGYVVSRLLETHRERVALLVRAKSTDEAVGKLWGGLQLHMDEKRFERVLPLVSFVPGDLTAPQLGMSREARKRVADEATSVLHIAASLNRKSEKACLNANLRGTLSVVQLAREIQGGRGGLRRFSHVSTVAVCGKRDREVVQEDTSVDWERSDYDPYGRTKKFAEHMVRELLPDVQRTYFRPSIVMGDSRFAETTQFDMVRAFCILADFPALPWRAETRLDIVNADYVGRAIADVHLEPKPAHEIYHLSSGAQSKTAAAIGDALLSRYPERRRPRFVPSAEGPFASVVDRMASMTSKKGMRGQMALVGSLLKVFLPYITYDTVFDNSRIVAQLGEEPVPFTDYCGDLYAWAKSTRFTYPYRKLTSSAPVRGEGAAWA